MRSRSRILPRRSQHRRWQLQRLPHAALLLLLLLLLRVRANGGRSCSSGAGDTECGRASCVRLLLCRCVGHTQSDARIVRSSHHVVCPRLGCCRRAADECLLLLLLGAAGAAQARHWVCGSSVSR
jgi:hypothetical protein